jgi:hypothetical protein
MQSIHGPAVLRGGLCITDALMMDADAQHHAEASSHSLHFAAAAASSWFDLAVRYDGTPGRVCCDYYACLPAEHSVVAPVFDGMTAFETGDEPLQMLLLVWCSSCFL